MALSQRLNVRQSQSLVMTPQLQEAIRLLGLSHLELAEYVDREVQDNPLLEHDHEAAERAPAEAEAVLQAAGVPAHAVIRASSAVADPQLAHRGHLVRVPHSLHGESVVEGSRFRLSRTPAVIGQPPAVGEHTEQVLKDILGYDDERIAALAAAGAFD